MAPLREVHSLKLQLCAGPNMHVVNYTNKNNSSLQDLYNMTLVLRGHSTTTWTR